ncbi:MAG: TolC family outer membrane protein [Hahellaceae bacterium]|jgi:outer membrane protein|nr:TolC family outer membrane protein [Hahellaceae bacterium]MCP5210565.1 TolC family outer membrane protein [Hahellaceae bacterium]
MLKKIPFAQALLLTGIAFSNPALSTDLATAYKLALDYDSAIAASNASLMAQREGESQALAGLLPQINLSAGAAHNDRTADQAADDSYVTSTYGVSLTQPVFRAQTWFSYQASKSNTKIAEAQFEISQQQLILDVSTAYFNVLRAQDQLTTTQAAEAAFKRQWEQSKERFDVGLIAITEVHEARATYDSSQTARIRAEGNLDIALESLSRLTGTRIDTLSVLAEDFPITQPAPTNLNAWLEQSLANNLSVKAGRYTLETLQESLKVEKSGHYPTLDLYASYDNSDFNGPSPADDNQNQASVGLSFNLPLYQGGGTQASVKKARYQVEEARHNLDTVTRNVKLDTTRYYRTINTDIQTVNSQKQLIVSRESALEATRAGYSVGTRNIVEVLDAERNYYLALFDYATARYDYVIDTLLIKQAAGTLSPQDIIDLNAWLRLAPPASASSNP